MVLGAMVSHSDLCEWGLMGQECEIGSDVAPATKSRINTEVRFGGRTKSALGGSRENPIGEKTPKGLLPFNATYRRE